MTEVKNQEKILKDKNKAGKDRDWRGRKILNLRLAAIFKVLGYKKNMIERVTACGEVLKFIQEPDGNLKLHQAYFCKNKLCSLCNWRRSMKYSYQTSQIVDKAIQEEPKGRFLFLTLTVKNVEGEDLKDTLSQMTQGFNRLFKYKKVQKNLIGYLRAVEVTHNENSEDYHPHIHVLLMVRPTYFKNKDNYLTQKEWGQLWAKAIKTDYVPMVDIRAVKSQGKGLKGAILETAKYPTKPIKLDIQNAQVVDDLYKGLYRKRQLGFGGLFKEIKKTLNFDDVEDGDLVHTTDDKTDLSEGTIIVAVWNMAKQNYFLK